MTLALKTPRQVTLIVNNVVAACSDIEKLNRTGYNYIYQCSGFIAHYNLGGFKSAYSPRGSLYADIKRNEPYNRWLNFKPGDENYDYYRQRAEIYRQIVSRI